MEISTENILFKKRVDINEKKLWKWWLQKLIIIHKFSEIFAMCLDNAQRNIVGRFFQV